MRALSVRQPWAGLILSGRKTLEIRSWSTTHRGPLVICSCSQPFKGYKAEKSDLACILCLVDLIDVSPWEPSGLPASCIPGDWFPGQMAWALDNPRPLERLPFKGKLGLFQIAPDLVRPL